MRIKEVAKIAGVSVRTLHHYDEIGLLNPYQTTQAGYRLYSNANLETLQQILLFKELGFSLSKIKEILHSPSFDQHEALALHRDMLMEKRQRIDRMITLVDKTIKHKKGELDMSNIEKFEGFDFSKNPYEAEAREKWGDNVIDQSKEKIRKMSRIEQAGVSNEFDSIFKKLATLKDGSPENIEAQSAIKEWYHSLNKVGHYTLAAFKGLGQMYVEDVRFTKNIDQYGEGLALFMRDAMAYYTEVHQEDEQK